MSRRKSIRLLFSGSSSSSRSDITPAPEVPWTLVGPSSEHLLEELESLYWQGVKAELENIVRTLRVWEESKEFARVDISDETDKHIHGFDTFIDQVSQDTRAFAVKYGQQKELLERKNRELAYFYKQALARNIDNSKAKLLSSHLKSAVRKSIVNATPSLYKRPRRARRAWMLLQSAGFLDIDKLIEHRPPLDKVGFWKRPAIPQLKLSAFDEYSIPRFEPMHCMRTECNAIIRGSMFCSLIKSSAGTSIICEECYRLEHYGKETYIKAYKHCILPEAITPATSRKICHCKEVPHFDGSGQGLNLFPIEKDAKHINADSSGGLQCGLLKLGEIIAWAKYNGLQTVVGIKNKSSKGPPASPMQSQTSQVQEKGPRRVSTFRPRNLKMVSQSTIVDAEDRDPVSNTTSVATEAQADEDIPLFFRKFTEKYPFGNVHMALRVGPIVIENGVEHTKGGALVSLREMPVFHERFNLFNKPDWSLAVGGSKERELWRASRRDTNPKRFKAILKQVAGLPFSNVDSCRTEFDIIRDLLSASEKPFDEDGLPLEDQKQLLDSALEPALDKLKALMKNHVRTYLHSIAKRLVDPQTKLTWSIRGNNCQSFCNSLIDRQLFEPLVNGPDPANPLYVMSFVCPDEGYAQRGVKSKFDVPNGLTEEYLLRFHFGRHDEADIIDTYQEYWYDWGAFGGPLYANQDLYPWDCTEAYGRYPTRCGDCNLAKHVWAFPFDSWSMSTLHLSRDRYMYAPAIVDNGVTATGPHATPQSWMRNRLTVITATSLLHRAAAAMAQTKSFCKATAWFHRAGLRELHPALARVKLGGIHRAQPFSHYFEAGAYNHYFLAPWATRPRDEQIQAYELLRDGRVKMLDVPPRKGGRFGFGGDVSRSENAGYSGFWTDYAAMSAYDGAYDGSQAANQYAVAEAFAHADAGFPIPDVGPTVPELGPTCAVNGASQCGSGCGASGCGGAACGGGSGGDAGGGGDSGGGGGGGCGGGGGGGGCGGGGCGGGCGGGGCGGG